MTSQWEALVVGINNYVSFVNLQQLTAAANDAEAIALQLEESGDRTFRVQRLPRQPNQKGEWQIDPRMGVQSEELRQGIINLLNPPDGQPPETALFFFSGHGWRKNVAGQDEVFLATSEVFPAKGIYGIPMGWLGELIQSSPVKKIICWLDCCYSGELIHYLPQNKDYCIFTATRSYEPGIEIRHQEGLFTQALKAGLNPDNDPDGWIDSHKLAQYVKTRMAQTGQAPQCFNSERSILLTSKFARKAFQDECPYRSLAYFMEQPKDALLFHGRTKLTQDLLQRVRNRERLIAVFGASGSGKSSLLRAGLLYQLKLGQEIAGSNNWAYCPPFTPTESPLQKLQEAWGAVNLASDADHPAGLETGSTASPMILMIDQFEECFTMCPEEQRKVFIDQVTNLLEIHPTLQILIGMRSDFRDRLREYAQFTSKMTKVNVEHLSRAEIQEAIEQPAEFVGLRIEGRLKQQLINDVEDYPGSLPLLQYTLTELWYEARKQGEQFLRLKTYEDLGRIEGTLAKRADAIYASLSAVEQPVAQRILLELTQVGETLDARRRIRLGDLVNSHHSLEILEQVTQKLASDENRLITRSGTEKAGDSDARSKIVIDVVHEALIRHWEQLRQWKEKYQGAMVIERKIEGAAQEWGEKGKKAGDLLVGSKLGEAEEYVNNFSQLAMLDGMAEEFIQASIQNRHRNNWIRIWSISTVVGAVVIGGISSLFFAWKAQEQKTIAELKENGANVQIQLLTEKNVNLLISALATVGSNQKFNGVIELQVKSGLIDAVEGVRERNVFQGHQGWVNSVAISTDGTTIVSGDSDGTVRLWEYNGRPIWSKPPRVHEGYVKSVAISKDGTTIVSGGKNGKIALWDRSGKVTSWEGHKGAVLSVAISADGQTIVSAGKKEKDGEIGEIGVWDRNGKPIVPVWQGHRGSIYSVAISADGQTIVSGGNDRKIGTIGLWDRNGKEIIPPWVGHQQSVSTVTISADGKTIVSGGDDGEMGVWDRQGKLEGKLWKSHDSREVKGVGISADGQTIVSGGWDGMVKLWNRNGKQIGSTLQAYQGSVYTAAISADGKTMISGDLGGVHLWDSSSIRIDPSFKGHKGDLSSISNSADGITIASTDNSGNVELWNRDGKAIGPLWPGHKSAVKTLAISANGSSILSGDKAGALHWWDRQGKLLGPALTDYQAAVVGLSNNGSIAVITHKEMVEVWDRTSQKPTPLFKMPRKFVDSIAVSNDGEMIVSGGDNTDRKVRLWDRRGNLLAQPLQHREAIRAIAISDDGQTIVSGSEDKTIRLWDSSGKPIGSPLLGHTSPVSSIAILTYQQANRSTIASQGEDGTILLWQGVLWQNWVKVGCDRLRLHPTFTNPPPADASDQDKTALENARKLCLEYGQWTAAQKAEFLDRQKLGLAKK